MVDLRFIYGFMRKWIESTIFTEYGTPAQVPMGRKFRSLKIWMIMRAFGVNKIRANIRRHVRLAGIFEKLVKEDDRWIT